MKAIFKIKNIIHHANITTKSALHLFYSLVRPIMTYNCEIWGAYILNPKMFDMDGDHKSYEKIDLRFCKMLLGVHRKATNTAVRGELSRFRISLHILNKFLNIGCECLWAMGTLFCMHVI